MLLDDKDNLSVAMMIVSVIVITIIVAVIVSFLNGAIIMWLWNWLMPNLFGLSTITYWQGWGISMLAWCMFGGASSGSGVVRRND